LYRKKEKDKGAGTARKGPKKKLIRGTKSPVVMVKQV